MGFGKSSRTIFAFTIVFVGITSAVPCFAQMPPPAGKDVFTSPYFGADDVNSFMQDLADVHNNPVQVSDHANARCEAAYGKLFAKPNIRWSIFWGYSNDSDGHTEDLSARHLFESQLTKPCITGLALCEFSAQAGKPGEYFKTLWNRQRQPVTVHLRLYHSSVTSDVAQNEGLFRAQQLAQSAFVEAEFLKALNTDDVVFYEGHARHGSGPGFRPLTEHSKQWWLATLFQPMINNVLKTLVGSSNDVQTLIPQAPGLIGLFVCDGEAYYGEELARATHNQTALLLSRETAQVDDDSRTTYAASNAILAQACEDEFQTQLNVAIRTIYYYNEKGIPKDLTTLTPHLFDFFEREHLHSQNQIKMLLDERRLHEGVQKVDFIKDPKGHIRTYAAADESKEKVDETPKN